MLVSAAWLVPAIFGAIDRYAQARIWDEKNLRLAAVIFASADWLLYAFLTPLALMFARRWPLARPHVRRRALFHLALALVFCALWAGAGHPTRPRPPPSRRVRRTPVRRGASAAVNARHIFTPISFPQPFPRPCRRP